MAIDFSERVPVGAPADVVGRIMCDVARWPQWTASVSTVERTATGPLTVGETVVVKQPKLPPSTWTVTKVGPTGFEWASRSPGIRNVAGHWAADAGDGTCVAELTLSFAGPSRARRCCSIQGWSAGTWRWRARACAPRRPAPEVSKVSRVFRTWGEEVYGPDQTNGAAGVSKHRPE